MKETSPLTLRENKKMYTPTELTQIAARLTRAGEIEGATVALEYAVRLLEDEEQKALKEHWAANRVPL